MMMGMFDYVEFEAYCPKCGQLNHEWQSKSGGSCIMEKLKPWQVHNFYTDCKGCGCWLEYEVDAEVEHIVKKLVLKLITKIEPKEQVWKLTK